MSRKKITAKQYEFLQFLIDHTEETGVWPTYQEIIDHFGYKSPNSVTQNLKALKKKGHLEYNDERGYYLGRQHRNDRPASIPVEGIVAAGALRDTQEEDLHAITLDFIFPQFDQLFAIQVSNQSLRGGAITDGDYVLLADDEVTDGEPGAVLHDGQLALKRVHRTGNTLRYTPLQERSSSGALPTRMENADLLGRYVGYVTTDGIVRDIPGSPTVA